MMVAHVAGVDDISGYMDAWLAPNCAGVAIQHGYNIQ